MTRPSTSDAKITDYSAEYGSKATKRTVARLLLGMQRALRDYRRLALFLRGYLARVKKDDCPMIRGTLANCSHR